MAGPGIAHRAGAFKQSNKGHNTGRHRSKGAVEKENRGRVGLKAISGKRGVHKSLAKIDRRNKAVQLRRAAREEVAARKRQVGGAGHPPIVVAVVPLLDSLVVSVETLVTRLTSCVEDVESVRLGGGHITTFTVPRFKQRMTVVVPDFDSIQSVLDVCKVCDTCVFLMSATRETEEWGDTLLSSILAQGLSADPIFLVDDISEIAANKQTEAKKLITKNLEKKFVVDKVWSAQNETEALNLLRHIGNQKRREQRHRDRRGYMLAESHELRDGDKLAVSGYVRGGVISANRLIHIPGLGDFQIDKIVTAQEPLRLSSSRKDEDMFESRDIDVSSEERQEIDCENVPDAMEGEQTWPTAQEMMEAEKEAQDNKVTRVKRLPKGFGEYMASWIVDEEELEEGDDAEDDSDEDMDDDEEDQVEAEEESEEEDHVDDAQSNFETESVAMTEDYTDYDTKQGVNFAKEVDDLEALKAARMEEQFPDEVDTPLDIPARVRFQKYRGLKSFRTSVWDAKENLPLDYARIWQFENFDRTRKRVLNEPVTGAEVGSYVTVIISGVPSHLASSLGPGLVLTALLPHEHRMSVMNFAVRRHIQSGSIPVKSKSRLIFQVGWRRFAACPVFSQHTNGNKHKYERYFRDGAVVMTTFAPITFPPAPVLVFQEHSSGELTLLATGSLLNNDPNRIVVKRTVLSGHLFKVNKRVCTVRFMFFNREDIEWFKPVELRTNNGRRGHIKNMLGTHGHMKCVFDGHVSQQDTVLLNLYKRVFPKWTYDPHVYLGHQTKSTENQEMV